MGASPSKGEVVLSALTGGSLAPGFAGSTARGLYDLYDADRDGRLDEGESSALCRDLLRIKFKRVLSAMSPLDLEKLVDHVVDDLFAH